MSKADRRSGATPEDLLEFGDGELAGDPSIAALIAVCPESEREAYRAERRRMLREISPTSVTWRAYFEGRR